MKAELDVCPVCGFVRRARGHKPGLCPQAFQHPGAGAVEPAPPKQREKVVTTGRERTQLVRVEATWTAPA